MLYCWFVVEWFGLFGFFVGSLLLLMSLVIIALCLGCALLRLRCRGLQLLCLVFID